MLATLAALGTVAHARCAGPRAFFSAPQSGIAPTSGELYLFTPASRKHEPANVRATLNGARVRVEVASAQGGPAYNVTRVAWSGLKPGKLRLVVKPAESWGRTVRTSVKLVDGWRPQRAVTGDSWVSAPSQQRDRWTCSHTSVQRVALAVPTPVYRVTFSRSQGDLVQIFPANMAGFWRRTSARPMLELGHVNCFGATYPPHLDAVVDIEALAIDGTVVATARGIEIPRSEDPTQ